MPSMTTTTISGGKLVFQLFAALAEFKCQVGGDFYLVPPIGAGLVPDKARFRHEPPQPNHDHERDAGHDRTIGL